MSGHGTAMYARESSTRGQMKSPSIAWRGEGGARVGSGELRLLSGADNRRSVMLPNTTLEPQRLAKNCAAASTVSAMSAAVCAELTKPASYRAGA